jgi:hypothetical protein
VKKNASRMLAGKPEGKSPLRGPRSFEDNTDADLKEIGWEDVDWDNDAQDRGKWSACRYTVMSLGVP